MEFGMFHEFPSLPGRSDTEAFDEGMAQVDAAERHGLDAMWLAEIHFAPERTHQMLSSVHQAITTMKLADIQSQCDKTLDLLGIGK